MRIEINQLNSYLQQAATARSNGERPWICEVAGEPTTQLDLVQQEQYGQSQPAYPWMASPCRKLALGELLKIAYENIQRIGLEACPEASAASVSAKEWLESNAVRCVQTAATAADANPQIAETVSKIKALNGIIQPLSDSLQALCDLSAAKRASEKANSIWGYIKWTILEWFYDYDKRMEAIKLAVPSEQSTLALCLQTIQGRLYEKMAALDARSNQAAIPNMAEMYDTPAKVKDIWLKSYRSVKGEDATARDEVKNLLPIWYDLITLQAPSPAPRSSYLGWLGGGTR